jgi:hypothetical protein
MAKSEKSCFRGVAEKYILSFIFNNLTCPKRDKTGKKREVAL